MWDRATITTVSSLAAFGSMFAVRRFAPRLGLVDVPNERSSHAEATPCAGGIAILIGIAAGLLLLGPPGAREVAAGAAIGAVALVSLADDRGGLSVASRLVAQVLAASVVVTSLDLPVVDLGIPGLPTPLPRIVGLWLSGLFLVAYANFFNFMDGIIGLASGQAAISAAALALLMGGGGSSGVAWAVCGASLGSLPHNFPRAKIFMGDVGAVTLGLLLATLSQWAHTRDGIPWSTILLIHAVFLADSVATILLRLTRGENVTRPHREHHFQLLVRAGWSHAETTVAFWTMSAACGIAALQSVGVGVERRWASLLIPTAALGLGSLLVRRRRKAPVEARA